MRALRTEARKKDKIITKKNFQLGALNEKVEVLMRSNASLFKELDQTIIGCSFIQQQSQLDIIQEEDSEQQQMDPADVTTKEYLNNYLSRKSRQSAAESGQMVKPGQILELQTRIELLTAENAKLADEKLQLELDCQEVEKQVEDVAKELKDYDYDFMEVLDD